MTTEGITDRSGEHRPITERIDAAAAAVGAAWPLHSFVTANPLAGFEDRPFHEAVADAEALLGGDGYPSADVFRQALERDRIDREVLSKVLAENGFDPDPDASLERLASTTGAVETATEATTATDRVDAVLSKWLAAFLDQGVADWSMPGREDGFYDAFRAVAPHDEDVPSSDEPMPEDPVDAIRDVLSTHDPAAWDAALKHQFAALPGWTGYLKQRAADDGAWQDAYPISLTEYMAVRLTLAERFDAPITPDDEHASDESIDEADEGVPLAEAWLRAWEATYRTPLVDSLVDASTTREPSDDDGRPDAQFVFCIDTRSEVVRRHVEAAGDYETHGYAGFFGVPMRYEGYDADVPVDACPPILDAQHRVADRPLADAGASQSAYDTFHDAIDVATSTLKSLKGNAATAFNFVESTGIGYAAALAARTLLPGRAHDLLERADERVPDDHAFCEPAIDRDEEAAGELPTGLALEERVDYAATAFELMGWETFARVVVFAGHASQTTNNPFGSSLDCGACAGNPGGPSARVLAAICNDHAVRDRLRDRGIAVPDDTVFVAGEHNTTTDEIDLYDDHVPDSHAADLRRLRTDLATAREAAAAERAADLAPDVDATAAAATGDDTDAGVRETKRRAADWAETRPEWGLAGNAGFVIGPRDLTDGLDLDGRSFLHSYDWRTDPDGDALEAILTGPMVVTQWINCQYYFATVDNAAYGSGSKVTQNPVGNVGVYQGNGGDLLTGLPQQSVNVTADDPYHQPLRLSTVVHAPVDTVTDVLAAHEDLTRLLDNDWLSLTVVDPQQDHRAFHYERALEWTLATDSARSRPDARTEPTAADD
jgi:uncharacterized protein YbcC (UPF0753/DUF2309 family)